MHDGWIQTKRTAKGIHDLGSNLAALRLATRPTVASVLDVLQRPARGWGQLGDPSGGTDIPRGLTLPASASLGLRFDPGWAWKYG